MESLFNKKTPLFFRIIGYSVATLLVLSPVLAHMLG